MKKQTENLRIRRERAPSLRSAQAYWGKGDGGTERREGKKKFSASFQKWCKRNNIELIP